MVIAVPTLHVVPVPGIGNIWLKEQWLCNLVDKSFVYGPGSVRIKFVCI